jgi:hypothetical protein
MFAKEAKQRVQPSPLHQQGTFNKKTLFHQLISKT